MPSNISNIRERVARARAALLVAGADLPGVLQELGAVADEARGLGSEASVPELTALRTELAAVGKLARNGEEFWNGWGRLLGVEPVAPAPRITVEG
jgi:hypothetical protein